MSRDKATDDVTTTAEHAGKEASAYVISVPGIGAMKSPLQWIKPDLTQGAMIQCDWNGDPGHPGTFQVKDDKGAWANILYLTPGGNNVQLVSNGDAVKQVHVERGPNNQSVRFAVKFIPIKWKTGRDILWHEILVKVGDDYHYDGVATADAVAWTDSSPTGPQGQHVVIFPTSKGQDYEIWVKLQHPTDSDPEKFKVQDPVIRTGANIPTGGGGTGGMSGSRTE